MQFIKPGINVDFIGKRKIAFILSLVMIAVSIGSLVIKRGPDYGIDFAGGTLIQVKFEAPVTIDQIKSGLATMDLAASAVQQFGHANDHEYLIRTDATNPAMEGLSETIEKNLKAATNVPVETRRVEMVGPQVGQDLREKALFAMFYALLLITVYISGRFELKWALSGIVAAAIMGAVYLLSLFHVSVPFLMLAALVVSLVIFWFFEFKYAMGAIVALIHDVTITVGMFSIFDKEFTLPIVAALLTIIGYSLNDTIIVFDRIRENLRKYHKEPLGTILNKSINETLSRTILTSGTTLIVVVALFILGGGIIHDFSFALLVGILVGTYSSIFVASPILLAWQTRRK
ncbi:MAG: protein translocase subunit SecF [Desulfobacteraceae bacterium]|jgi:preprotein translocase subunit SecF|nr:protein translocase subunit SecF [Desulfobacteraceae bacterium]